MSKLYKNGPGSAVWAGLYAEYLSDLQAVAIWDQYGFVGAARNATALWDLCKQAATGDGSHRRHFIIEDGLKAPLPDMQKAVADFLAQGGEIKKIEPAKSGIPEKPLTAQQVMSTLKPAERALLVKLLREEQRELAKQQRKEIGG